MTKSKRISKGARADMLIGARPLEMWSRTAILIQVKRLLPRNDFEIAKRTDTQTLCRSISPIIFSNHEWRDGRILGHYVFSPYRFYLAIGHDDLAIEYKQRHSGKEYDIIEACEANKPWDHRAHV